MSNERAYPKPWEVLVSRILTLILPLAQITTIVFVFIALFTMPWKQVLILCGISVAIHYCQLSVNKLLVKVSDDDNPSR
ncbi:MAG: hypothetical protein JHC33_03070 [Ignisphaera sp.]|nr:hypothetical protein [Ignisphaera sp.]